MSSAEKYQHADGVVFAQLAAFSHTNDVISGFLQKKMDPSDLHVMRTFNYIAQNKLYLGLCVMSALYHHGPRILLKNNTLHEAIRRTPMMFNLATRLIKKFIKSKNGIRAVLQTQGLFNAKVEGIPLIIYTDNTILNAMNSEFTALKVPRRLIMLETGVYNSADTIAVSASHVAESLERDYGVAKEKIRVIFIGANAPTVVQPVAGRYHAQKILFVGIDWERKGGPDLIKAYMKILAEFPNSSLTIVGCKPRVACPNVTELGKIPLGEIPKLMAESSVFCLPSRVEPSSVAAIEAARSGLPIIATRAGGFLDSVVDGETGLLVAPSDVDALAEALARLLRAPDLCQLMGAAGAQWINERFDWSLVVQKLEGLMGLKI